MTKQKLVIDSQQIKKVESEHTTMENHQFTKECFRKGSKEQETTARKQ